MCCHVIPGRSCDTNIQNGMDDVVELFLRTVSNRFVPRGLHASYVV